MLSDRCQGLIDSIRRKKARFRERLRPPASDEAIASIERRFRESGCDQLPLEYLELLRICDGLEENGVIIYSATPRAGEWAFLDAGNAYLCSRDDAEDLIAYGHSSLYLFCFWKTHNCYVWMPLGGREPDEVFSGFAEMLEASLWLCLKHSDRPECCKEPFWRT